MLRKAVTALLLLMVTLPFTAPFATCDVTKLIGGDTVPVHDRQTLTRAVLDPLQVAAFATVPRRGDTQRGVASSAVAVAPVVHVIVSTPGSALPAHRRSGPPLPFTDSSPTPLRL